MANVLLDNRSMLQGSIAPAVPAARCQVVVIWIDWYSYHVARFQGLLNNSEVGTVEGIELVGGAGVHAGLNFRGGIPASLPVKTLLPNASWDQAGTWRLSLSLWRHLNRLRPAVVLVPGYYTVPALAAALWAKLKGKTSVLMTESTAHDHHRTWVREGIKKLVVRWLFDWAVAGGKPHKRYLLELGFPSSRIASFYDVVDNDFFCDCCNDLRKSHHSQDFGLPENYFLYVGRIASEKNTDALFGAYIRYRQSGGTWALVLVGDGPQMGSLRKSVSESGYSGDVHFAGLKATADLPHYYAFASAFVLPSRREPWGLVVNEAMAAGLPVIVSDRCGCVEDLVVPGENGFVFDPADPDSLAACLIRFGLLSAPARSKMGHSSCEIVSHFSLGHWAGEIARIVNS